MKVAWGAFLFDPSRFLLFWGKLPKNSKKELIFPSLICIGR